jgi:hypothetical protein
MAPIKTDKAPKEEASARSLSPNQFEAILLGKFIKKGYPSAAMNDPMKKGKKSVKMIKHRIQDPINIKRVPVTMVAFMPYLLRTAIDIKLPGTYIM